MKMERNDVKNSGIMNWDNSLQAFEKLPELILSPAKKVLTATDAWLNAMGLSRTSVQISDVSSLFNLYNTSNEYLASRILRSLDEVIAQRESRIIDAQQIRHRYYEIIQTPVLNERQEIEYIIHKLLDITRLIKKEIEFERRIEQDVRRLTDTIDLLTRVEEAGSTGSYQLDLKTRRISFSDGMYRLLGYHPGSFEPSLAFLESISYENDDQIVSDKIADAIARKGSYEYTRRIFHSNGELRYILSKGKVITDLSGESLSVLGVSHDVTEQKRSSEALQKAHEDLLKSNAMLQSVFDATMIGMSLLKPLRSEEGEIIDFEIMLVSRGLEKETKRTDLVGKHYTVEYPGIKPAGLFDRMLKVMESGEPEQMEYYYPYDGFSRWYSCTFVKLDNSLVATNLDITPIREAEANMRAMEENQKSEIFKASIRTQEEERKRIAEDLRNGIGQLLYAAKINLKHVESGRAVSDPEGFHHSKQYTDRILAEAIKEIRRLSHQMTPAILEDFGLEETVIELCKQFRPVIDISCQVTGIKKRLDAYLEVSVYRMVQELLMNVINHAQASEAIIDIKQAGATLEVLVQDNGIGFSPSQAGKEKLGLATLMNKVRLLNGTINIEGHAGTKVTIALPL
jgi:PAS domain S-box-containing protein